MNLPFFKPQKTGESRPPDTAKTPFLKGLYWNAKNRDREARKVYGEKIGKQEGGSNRDLDEKYTVGPRKEDDTLH